MSTQEQLRFDGKVAIITGAGGGLGRSHALLFAGRGAKVLVNDLGGSARGEGKSESAADRVVAEIRAQGGEAAASYDSVENGGEIVKTALDRFGRVDIVVSNAGILRDQSFHKMSDEDWDAVYRVHVLGSFRLIRAAWPHMREQQYGRVVVTSSAAGVYGNFGQTNYGTAKLGLVGFMKSLAEEGKSKNVHANAIAPVAMSRLTESMMPKELSDILKPEHVSPLVAYLCHERCEETGGLFEVGGGFFAKLRWERAKGAHLPREHAIAPEAVAEAWPRIAGFEESTHPASVQDAMGAVIGPRRS
jgi:3-hydroxyacyl-CoA dehydrogenase/3a,7a,12a-trihydroxy-5b-cholest-24-enoyl-CoA hydratase